jgi:hypothetical protein
MPARNRRLTRQRALAQKMAKRTCPFIMGRAGAARVAKPRAYARRGRRRVTMLMWFVMRLANRRLRHRGVPVSQPRQRSGRQRAAKIQRDQKAAVTAVVHPKHRAPARIA